MAFCFIPCMNRCYCIFARGLLKANNIIVSFHEYQMAENIMQKDRPREPARRSNNFAGRAQWSSSPFELGASDLSLAAYSLVH